MSNDQFNNSEENKEPLDAYTELHNEYMELQNENYQLRSENIDLDYKKGVAEIDVDYYKSMYEMEKDNRAHYEREFDNMLVERRKSAQLAGAALVVVAAVSCLATWLYCNKDKK